MNYKNLLFEIQNIQGVGPAEKPVENVEQFLSDYNMGIIDLNTRTITAPEFLSVESEHKAETIYFIVDRYFGNMDLAQTNCIVQYSTDNGNTYIYPIMECDVTTFLSNNKMILPWTISSDVTQSAGSIEYVFRFYQLEATEQLGWAGDGSAEHDSSGLKFIYSLTTLPARSKILKTLPIENASGTNTYNLTTNDKFYQLLDIVERIANEATIYWIDV